MLRVREYLRTEAEANGPVLFSLRLTPLQAGEVEYGLGIDQGNVLDKEEDALIWGWIEYRGKTVAILHVTNIDGAVYRITSSRDIFLDIAQEGPTTDRVYIAHGRSLEQLAQKVIEAAGGLEAVSSYIRLYV